MRRIPADRAGKIEGPFTIFSSGSTHKNPPSSKTKKYKHHIKCVWVKGFSDLPMSRPSIGRQPVSFCASFTHKTLENHPLPHIWPLSLEVTLIDFIMHRKMFLGFLSSQKVCSKLSIPTVTCLVDISMGVPLISFRHN